MISRRKFTQGLLGATGLTMAGNRFAGASAQEQDDAEKSVKAVVLGSAQDGGLPHIGCRKAHCEAARTNPSLRRRSPCVALLDEAAQQSYCLDAGPDFHEQLADLPNWGERGRPVEGIFLTHAHIGHYTGLMHLGREALGAKEVPVYCSKQMADFLTNNGPWSLLVKLKNIAINVIEPGETIKLNDRLSIRPLAVDHRAEYTDTFAFIAQGPKHSLLYLPDIDRWDGMEPSIETLVTSVDIALLDGSFYSNDELPHRNLAEIPHPRVTDSMQRLQKIVDAGSSRVIFTHLNHSNMLLDENGKLLNELRKRGYDIAEDGMELEL